MAATLRLDRFEILWYCDGFIGKSHLRWSGYAQMVNDVWPQLSESEREFIFAYVKRDSSWLFNNEKPYVDETAKQYFLQMLARYNPANQYIVTMKKGREARQIVDDAYLWDGKYYVGWQRYCATEYIKEVEQKPYNKCENIQCAMKDVCLRWLTFKNGDKTLDGAGVWTCNNCDLLITKAGVIDPIAKMVITKENREDSK